MLSEKDVSKIKKVAIKSLNGCIGFNNSLDPQRLLKAIATAISEAIKEYDQLCHS